MAKPGALTGQQTGRSVCMIEFSFFFCSNKAAMSLTKSVSEGSFACVDRCASVEATEL